MRSNGSTGALGELVFETDRVNSRYRGDRGVAGWAPAYDAAPSVAGVQARSINAHGYGRLTDLAVAASQDLAVACRKPPCAANDDDRAGERVAA